MDDLSLGSNDVESAFPYAPGVHQNNAVLAIVVSTAVWVTPDSWSELTKPTRTDGLRALAH